MKPFDKKPYVPKVQGVEGGPVRPAGPVRPVGKIRPPAAPGRIQARSQPPHLSKPPTPSRRVALEALSDVAAEGAYSTLALDKRLRESRLSPEDRRLATALFYGVIEKRMALEYILSKFMQRPAEDIVTRENLKMAAYQIFYMEIPDYAACGEAVTLSRALGREALCSLVNAVTRRMAKEKDSVKWPENPVDRLSIETSTPPWLIRVLQAEMGAEQAEAFLRYAPEEHFTSIFINTLRTDQQELARVLREEGFPVREGLISGSLRISGGGLADTEAFRKGLFTIQAEASTLAAMAVGVKGGMRVFDACAAPGGKSFAMAQMMRGSGRVHAMDLHDHRVKLIEAGAKRLGLENIRPRVGDARQPVNALMGQMDAVLVDAPCSGLGILGKMDVRQRLTPADLEALPKTQQIILDSCSSLVKPGGALVYSTCTVLSAENRGVVEAFLASHSDFALEGLERHLPEAFRDRVEQGTLNLLPQRDGTDGFFIARMVRAR